MGARNADFSEFVSREPFLSSGGWNKCMLHENETPCWLWECWCYVPCALQKWREWRRNQLTSELQNTRNISQRNKCSLYLYTARPHFSRISWLHKLHIIPFNRKDSGLPWNHGDSDFSSGSISPPFYYFSFPGSSSLLADLYRLSLTAPSFCGHAVLDWLSSLLCHRGAVSSCFSLCSLLRWPTLGERASPNLLKPAPAPLRSKLYCLLFQSTVPPEHSSSRYHLSDFMSFYFFCKFNYLPLDSSKFSSFLVLLFLFILN